MHQLTVMVAKQTGVNENAMQITAGSAFMPERRGVKWHAPGTILNLAGSTRVTLVR